MLDVLDFITSIIDGFVSWRLFLSLCITGGIIFLVFVLVHDQSARWVICMPIGLAGLILGFRWQKNSETC